MSALFDRDNPPRRQPYADDDTAEIPIPTGSPCSEYGDPAHHRPGSQPRSTGRSRRRKNRLLLVVCTTACLGSAWGLGLALLRLNLTVMLLMTGLVVWLLPDTVRLARWLHQPDRPDADADAQPVRLSLQQKLIASVLAVLYAYLLLDRLL